MPPRLHEQYVVGARVAIQFGHDSAERWWPGTVAAHDPPGIWVRLADGRRFFVTNTRRIRLHPPSDDG